MHAHAAPLVPFFDALFPTQEAISAEIHTLKPRKAIAAESRKTAEENILSLEKAYQRLCLLSDLELPCTILVTEPHQLLRHALLRDVSAAEGGFSVLGETFKLRLQGENFQTIRLVNGNDREAGMASLDIYDANGFLYASIQPESDGLGGAVWRDVMDNPSLALT